jgi:hypothetical protein
MGFRRRLEAGFAVTAVVLIGGCSGAPDDPLEIPDSPDGTVRVVVGGLADHRPEVVWRALPPTYRQDVDDLAMRFADSVDPALFNRTVSVARKATFVLQRKKTLIFATDAVQGSGIDPETLDAAWESSIHIVDAVLASDLARLEAYRDLDVEAVLATTGSEIMGHLTGISCPGIPGEALADRIDDLERTRAELVSRDGDVAVVRMTPPDGDPVDLEMIRVEDRWLPADVVKRWPDAMAEARARLDHLDGDEGQRTKMQLHVALGVAERFIDQVDKMDSPEDFDALLGGFLGSFIPIPREARHG